MQRGYSLAQAGDWSGAAAALDQAVQLAPEWADAHYLRGLAYVQLAGTSVGKKATEVPDETHDYALGLQRLRIAIQALETYERLSAAAPDHVDVSELINAYRTRAESVALAEIDVQQTRELAENEARASRREVGWWLTGLGGAMGLGAVTAAVFGSNEISKIGEGGFATADDIDAARKKGDVLHTVALGLGSTAMVLCGIGVPLIFANPPKSQAKTPALVQAKAAPGGLMITAGTVW